MRFRLLLVITVSFIAATGLRSQQDTVLAGSTFLNELLAKRDLIYYFRKIDTLSEVAHSKEDSKTLLQLMEYLKKDFDSLQPQEKRTLRSTATYVGNRIRDLTGNNNYALEMYLIAHENVSNKITLDSNAWFIENKIANIYTAKDEYEKAEYFSSLLERSLIHYNLAERLSRFYTNKGRRLNSEGKVEEAIVVFNRGYALADSIGFVKGIFANALNLAELYNEYTNWGYPEFYVNKCDSLISKLKGERDYLENVASLDIAKGHLKVNQDNYAEGIQHYNRSIDSLSKYYRNPYRREFAKLYKLLASAYLVSGSIQDAEDAIHKGLKSLIPELTFNTEFPEGKQIYAENSFVELLSVKINLLEKQFAQTGNQQYLEKALIAVRLALLANDLIRESLVADPSKLLSIKNNKLLIKKSVMFAHQLYQLEGEEKWIDVARSFFNRSKSLLYDEKTYKSQLLTKLSPENKEKVKGLQKKLSELHASKYAPGADLIAINGEIFNCNEYIEEILTPYKSGLKATRIPKDYIEYLVTDENIYVLSELDGKRYFQKLISSDLLEPLLTRLDDYIRLKNFSTDEKILNELYNVLIAPISNELPARLVIITDEFLGYVPFEILKNNKGEYLIEKSTIAYSFEFETEKTTNDNSVAKWEVVCLAPQYPVKESPSKTITRGSVYHLPFAKVEVETICGLYGEKALSIPLPFDDSWKELLKESRIFHYAGHAIVKEDKAYLALGPNDIEEDQLTAEEISLTHYPIELVVLSACETATGVLAQGEGIQSLGRSFMESGAKSSVISLWNVNDKSTSQIIGLFYKNLKSGLEKDESLRMAKLEYLNNAPANLKHPFFWAPFIPTGDMCSLDQ